ncbi:hypothetical protein MKEN_00563200 [Mycena kentingensis (nom. inval.)]|nr:hypothetical protein MKEN_00563200 [Mycena kentingensis (nom. inval.)]
MSLPPFKSATRRRVPPRPFAPSEKWRRSQKPPQPMILFDYPGLRGQGISMRDLALGQGRVPMENPQEAVLARSGVRTIVFRIIWPGYESSEFEWARSISVVNESGAHIPRQALAIQIAASIESWVEKAQYWRPSDASWAVMPRYIEFKNMFLVALVNTFDDVWQADVALDVA